MEEDSTRLLVHGTWYINNKPMTMTKWSLDFCPNHDSSIAPVWINMSGLPVPLFDKLYLHKIASLIGQPLQVDASMLDLKWPSITGVLVEIDVAKKPKE